LEDGGNDNRHADDVAKSWSRCCQHGASSDPMATHAIIAHYFQERAACTRFTTRLAPPAWSSIGS
jgi:hypothetical protein